LARIPDIDNWGFSGFPDLEKNVMKQAMTASFYILSNPYFTNHHTIRRYIISTVEKASLNK
jgi:hypothetical protein